MAQSHGAIRVALSLEGLFRWSIGTLSRAYQAAGGETVSILWLVSYPRSGSTWLRDIVSNCFSHDRVSFIPSIHENRLRSPSDLTQAHLPMGKVALIKSHTVDFPIHRLPLSIAVRARSVGFVYIYRHPLDVLLSSINYLVIRHLDRFLLNRRARSVEELKRTGELLTYLRLFEKDFTIGRNAFLRMCGANWLDHVNAHISRNGALPRQSMILTYEGLQEDPVAGAAPLKDLLGVSEGRLADAVQATSESTSADGRFFWKMTSRNFANYFPDDAIAEFLARHAEHLAPLGYTPD